jgi:hypothetical protein
MRGIHSRAVVSQAQGYIDLLLMQLGLNIADPVVGRPQARAFSARTLDRRFEPRLRHGCLSLVSLCCVVLCREEPCDGTIACPNSPTKRRKTDQGTKGGRGDNGQPGPKPDCRTTQEEEGPSNVG